MLHIYEVKQGIPIYAYNAEWLRHFYLCCFFVFGTFKLLS